MKFAISVLSHQKFKDNKFNIRHSLGFIEAANQYEAEGKAAAIAKKLYPPKEDWTGHHVLVESVDANANVNVVEVENVGHKV